MRPIAALVCALFLASCLDTPTERIKPSGADGSDGDGGSSTYCDTDDDCHDRLFSRCSSSHVCVACANSTQCTQFDATPACVAGKGCFACADDNPGTCSSERPLCSVEHECAQCTGGNTRKCQGETPYCLEEAGTCVGCITSADCKDPTAGACSATHGCERCDADDDCQHFEATPFCATERGECVACKSDADCGAEAPVCDETRGVCGGCTENAECARFEGTKVCGGDGACAACTVDDESACGDNSCDPASNTCTTTARGSRTTCQTCVADSECQDTYRCVETFFGAEGQGGHCLMTDDGGCLRPFVSSISRGSVSHPDVVNAYCGFPESLTTCEAILGLLERNDLCPSAADAECSQPSGLCRKVGAQSNACTYPCGRTSDCPDGIACGTPDGQGVRYCGGA